ncbi:putative zinc finger protein [Streptomyces sp. 1114.5]|uniref:anti-sigma factor family protein n=1 Tax=Streptomyces sp. 1114.5 TaxID=1938830 RepID=UPI000F2071EC|nr:zf-HC2 domain-containing protein [Streptomyces sp. 1114.5]RKT12214.1 putative zinc finger protein [Streptomyces sp. 1114.5]
MTSDDAGTGGMGTEDVNTNGTGADGTGPDGTGPVPPERIAELVGAYVLGVLDPAESAAVERHLADCPACRQEVAELRELETVLGEVPPELMVDGPPTGGDLLLQRTLRQARAERGSALVRRRTRIGTVAAVAAAAALVLGIAVGRGTVTAPPVAVGPAPTAAPTATVTPPPAGTRTGSVTDPATGARMTLTMTPAMGWVRVNAAVTGIPAGQRCHLVVNARGGTTADAGSWLVSAVGAKSGTTLDGSAIVAPEDVVSVSVVNESGQTFVTVPV